jgi:hypothetical protein
MNKKINDKTRVVLEPTLESKVYDWTACQRRELACTFERWARQLRVSAKIIDRGDVSKPSPRSKARPPRCQRLH